MRVKLPASPQLRDGAGLLLPGSLAILADVCCGALIATGLPPGRFAMTAQLRVEFVRPIRPDARWFEGNARLDSVDEHGGLARAELIDDGAKLLAIASMRSLSSVNRRGGPTASADTPAPELVSPQGPVSPDGGIADLLGLIDSSAIDGRADWSLAPGHAVTNSFNAVHGGIVALLAHAVAREAQQSVLGSGERLVPMDLGLDYYRGLPISEGPVTASAEVAHRGRRFIVASGQVVRADGRPAVRFSAGAQIRPD
jgi:uncharacterized protein (TIGR00369 family)